MGSSFFGRPKLGGSSSSSPTSSSSSSFPAKRGKNRNGSDKPKQPQRGLGVAQLEKIRLHGELNCDTFNTYPSYHHHHPSMINHQEMQGGYSSSSPSFSYGSSSPSSAPYGFHPNMMMNASNGQYERTTTIRYGDSQPHIAPSWNPSYDISESQHFGEPDITRHFLQEDPRNRGSGLQNFETSDANELDLELKLSL